MGQFEFIIWLATWYVYSSEFTFEWDDGNLTKSESKHSVTKDEVEFAFCSRKCVPIGTQVSPVVKEERFCVVGPTEEGRVISIIFTLRSGRVRPISSRDASRKERKLYEKIRQKA